MTNTESCRATYQFLWKKLLSYAKFIEKNIALKCLVDAGPVNLIVEGFPINGPEIMSKFYGSPMGMEIQELVLRLDFALLRIKSNANKLLTFEL